MTLADVIKKYSSKVKIPPYVSVLREVLKPLGYEVNFDPTLGELSVEGKSFSYVERIDGWYGCIFPPLKIRTSRAWEEPEERVESLIEILESVKWKVNIDGRPHRIFAREVVLEEIKKQIRREPFIDEKGSFESSLSKEVIDRIKPRLDLLL